MSECWHYNRFDTISDGTISSIYCTYLLPPVLQNAQFVCLAIAFLFFSLPPSLSLPFPPSAKSIMCFRSFVPQSIPSDPIRPIIPASSSSSSSSSILALCPNYRSDRANGSPLARSSLRKKATTTTTTSPLPASLPCQGPDSIDSRKHFIKLQ